ncbi:MAG: hypothetical protein JW738_00525 [Actinobacteria bacterium]|nr:hypothetical protein [Actinomycetota bacterium]
MTPPPRPPIHAKGVTERPKGPSELEVPKTSQVAEPQGAVEEPVSKDEIPSILEKPPAGAGMPGYRAQPAAPPPAQEPARSPEAKRAPVEQPGEGAGFSGLDEKQDDSAVTAPWEQGGSATIDEVADYTAPGAGGEGLEEEQDPEVDKLLEQEIQDLQQKVGGEAQQEPPQPKSQEEINSFFFEEDVEKKEKDKKGDGDSFWE